MCVCPCARMCVCVCIICAGIGGFESESCNGVHVRVQITSVFLRGRGLDVYV